MTKTPKRVVDRKKPSKKTAPARKQGALQAQYDLLETLLNHIADPVFVKDREHRIIYGNRALSEMLGLPPEKYIGKSDYECFLKEQADVFREKDNKVFRTGEVDLNEEHLTDSHGKLHILSTKKTLCTIAGGDPVIVGITRDVTAFKEMERLKSEFIAMISHELRTPLTSIHASLALLSSGAVCSLPADTEAMMKIAYRNSERLVRLVNQILDIEKIEAGMMHPVIAPVAVDQFLLQAIDENSAYGKKHGVSFELGELPEHCTMLVDANRLMQVMANLLSNAAKFSKQGTKVVVGATVVRNHIVRLHVRDSGAGIPEKFHSKIFEKFIQGDSSITRKQGGTGLGLNITKKLVEAMGGAISFKSKLGKGSVFYVDLPMSESTTTAKRRYATR